MNVASIILAVVVLLIVTGAAYGCYRAMRSKSCCGGCKGTEKCESVVHCSVKKSKD